MFVWAKIPESYSELNSIEFCEYMIRECNVAVSPGAGFGPGGEDYVRFALVENEQRIQQAIRGIKKGLTKLG
jgi:alanine-synthesizing transaminase